MVTRRTLVKGAVAAPVLGSALLASARRAGAQDDPVIIGSKDFTEQFVLAEIYAALLEEAGIPYELAKNLGGTGVAQTALVEGEISLYPEYTGTALTVVLQQPFPPEGAATPGATPAATPAATTGTPAAGDEISAVDQQVYDLVAAAYQEQFDLVWLDQSPFNDDQNLAVTRAFSEERGVTTISQLAEIAGDLTISAPSDFLEREDGFLGLQRVYGGGFEEIEVLGVAPGIKYQAIEEGDAEVVLAFGTDPQIGDLDLVLLEDDKNLFPPGHVAPVVRQETLDAYPELAETLNAVAPLLTYEVISGLNAQVDLEGAEDAEVARQFLREQGLIGG